jgi:hypothetical protein
VLQLLKNTFRLRHQLTDCLRFRATNPNTPARPKIHLNANNCLTWFRFKEKRKKKEEKKMSHEREQQIV